MSDVEGDVNRCNTFKDSLTFCSGALKSRFMRFEADEASNGVVVVVVDDKDAADTKGGGGLQVTMGEKEGRDDEEDVLT